MDDLSDNFTIPFCPDGVFKTREVKTYRPGLLLFRLSLLIVVRGMPDQVQRAFRDSVLLLRPNLVPDNNRLTSSPDRP